MRTPSFVLLTLTACNITKPKPAQSSAKPLPGITLEAVELPTGEADATTDTGLWPSLMRDPHGALHVAYCDSGKGDAKLAHEKPGGGWEIEIVDSKGAVGKYLSAAWGEDGAELVYLDQSKKTLRYAHKGKDGWSMQNLGSDNEDLGISGRFRIAANGDRLYAYYNTRNELFLATGKKAEAGMVWETHKIAKAGAVYTISIDLAAPSPGSVVITYPDWAVSSSTLYFGRVEGKELKSVKIDDEQIAGLKTELVPRGVMYDVLYMTGRGGLLYLATQGKDGWAKKQLSTNIANIASTTLPDGRLAVAMQVGRADGLGEGALHYGERDAQGVWTEYIVDEARPVGQYLSIAPGTGKTRVAIAYYDGAKKGLKLARIP